jgi:DNA-directed RNA polymerase specialized sigma24 family protein
MSASADLRKRRAEEIINRDYVAMRAHVSAVVAGSLRRRSIFFDEADLDAHYNIAWQGLYNELLAGTTVENPEGFLVTIMIRRAIDDSRGLGAQRRAATYELSAEQVADVGRDFDVAARLDDDAMLRQFVEGLKERLTKREREAAALCYIHGYSRPEAAAILSVEPKRMEKIMDAVSKKVGGFVGHIEAGVWCDARRSLMNAYAFGVLDRDGERYRLAREHLASCPACRRYIRAAQGLAAIVPPATLPIEPAGGDAGIVGGLLERFDHLLIDGAQLGDHVGAAKAGAGGLLVAGAGGSAAATGGGTAVVGEAAAAASAGGGAAAASAPAAAGGAGAVGAGGVAASTGGAVSVKAVAVLAAAVAAGGAAVVTGVFGLPASADGNPAANTRAAAVKQPAVPAGVKNISLPRPARAGTLIATKTEPHKATRRKPARTKRTARPTVRRTPRTRQTGRRPAPAVATSRAQSAPAPAATRHPSAPPAGSEFGVEGG